MNKNAQQDQNFDEQDVFDGLEYVKINATQNESTIALQPSFSEGNKVVEEQFPSEIAKVTHHALEDARQHSEELIFCDTYKPQHLETVQQMLIKVSSENIEPVEPFGTYTLENFQSIDWIFYPKWLETEEKANPGFCQWLFRYLQKNPSITHLVSEQIKTSEGTEGKQPILLGAKQGLLGLLGLSSEDVIGKSNWRVFNKSADTVIQNDKTKTDFRTAYLQRQQDWLNCVYEGKKIEDYTTVRDLRDKKLKSQRPGIYLSFHRTVRRKVLGRKSKNNTTYIRAVSVILFEMTEAETRACLCLGPEEVRRHLNLPERLRDLITRIKKGRINEVISPSFPLVPLPETLQSDVESIATAPDEHALVQALVEEVSAKISNLSASAKVHFFREMIRNLFLPLSSYTSIVPPNIIDENTKRVKIGVFEYSKRRRNGAKNETWSIRFTVDKERKEFSFKDRIPQFDPVLDLNTLGKQELLNKKIASLVKIENSFKGVTSTKRSIA